MPYAIERADAKRHKDDILDVWSGVLRTGKPPRFTWIHEKNPFGPIPCWLVRETGKDIVVGSASVCPRTIVHRGRAYRGGIAIDYAVKKNHRVLGPAVMLQKAAISSCADQSFDLIYALPNDLSGPVILRAGYKLLGKQITFRKPLRTRAALQRRFGRWAALASVGLDAALRLTSRETFTRRDPAFGFEELRTFDDRFDDFWNRMSATVPLTGERTSAFLNWRFASCSHKEFKTLALTHRDSAALAGYITWYLNEDEIVISDLLVQDFNRSFDALIAEFLRRVRRVPASAVVFRYFGGKAVTDRLQRFGFVERPSTTILAVHTPNGSSAEQFVGNPDNWYLLDGDADL